MDLPTLVKEQWNLKLDNEKWNNIFIFSSKQNKYTIEYLFSLFDYLKDIYIRKKTK